MVHGYRPVDPNIQCSLMDRTLQIVQLQVMKFSHLIIKALQDMVVFSASVDPALFAGTGVSPNFAFGYMLMVKQLCWVTEKHTKADGDDLVTPTNGFTMSTLIISRNDKLYLGCTG